MEKTSAARTSRRSSKSKLTGWKKRQIHAWEQAFESSLGRLTSTIVALAHVLLRDKEVAKALARLSEAERAIWALASNYDEQELFDFVHHCKFQICFPSKSKVVTTMRRKIEDGEIVHVVGRTVIKPKERQRNTAARA